MIHKQALEDRESSLPARPRIQTDIPGATFPVVYVAGSGHTGSTLLAMLVDAHPQIVSVGETSIKPKIRRRGHGAVQKCSCGELIAHCRFWQRVFGRVRELGFELNESRWSNDYRLEHPFLRRLLTGHSHYRPLRAFQDWAADHLPVYKQHMRNIGRVNVAFIRALLEVANADVFVDTSKRTSRLARLLTLPELDVRVVGLVRDVRGYAASAKRRGYPPLDAARTWVHDQSLISVVTRALPADRVMVLRYEDLCTDVEGALLRFYTFAGVERVPPTTSIETGQHHVIGNSMRFTTTSVRLDESWRQRLTAAEQHQILEIAGNMNRTFGYR
jgi:hypothetical protein